LIAGCGLAGGARRETTIPFQYHIGVGHRQVPSHLFGECVTLPESAASLLSQFLDSAASTPAGAKLCSMIAKLLQIAADQYGLLRAHSQAGRKGLHDRTHLERLLHEALFAGEQKMATQR